MGTLKRNQQVEKKKNANMLEEARKREDEVNEDASLLKVCCVVGCLSIVITFYSKVSCVL